MKLRNAREKCREDIQDQEQALFGDVNAIYFDGEKDATLTMSKQEIEGKTIYKRNFELEEHYVIVGEPGKLSLQSA